MEKPTLNPLRQLGNGGNRLFQFRLSQIKLPAMDGPPYLSMPAQHAHVFPGFPLGQVFWLHPWSSTYRGVPSAAIFSDIP